MRGAVYNGRSITERVFGYFELADFLTRFGDLGLLYWEIQCVLTPPILYWKRPSPDRRLLVWNKVHSLISL